MTEAATPVSDPVSQAEARSTIYQALALGWRYPDREAFAAYQSGQYAGELLEYAAALPHLAELVTQEARLAGQMAAALAEVPFEAFEVAYVATFDSGFPEPPCPPYEGLYTKRMERAQVMVEVSEFYRYFGMAMNQAEDQRELPDYLCAELEFLAFLAFKEAEAAHDGADELLYGYRLAQRDFLERHLVGWLPAFAARLAQEADAPFFAELARFTIGFARAELGLVSAYVENSAELAADPAQHTAGTEVAGIAQ